MWSDHRLTFTSEADDDLRSLLADTARTWGEAQLVVYSERLFAALRNLVAHPRLGRARDEILPGMRAILAGHHVIYYQVDEETVTIVRLLHERMDPARHIRPLQ